MEVRLYCCHCNPKAIKKVICLPMIEYVHTIIVIALNQRAGRL